MAQPKVLMIYTGGTIGMITDPKTGALTAFNFDRFKDHIPELLLIHVDLTVISLDTPIDSSDMKPEIWQEIARRIEENYTSFDGFVVLHGSDTMAYTASALSFMLQGLRKPVILTGSQIPIGTLRTDAKENLITSIQIAADKDKNGESIIQEVAIYFEDYLYRGNRTLKVSAEAFEAFESPNYPELATAGIEIRYDKAVCFRTKLEKLEYRPKMDPRIALVKIFPGGLSSIYQKLFDFSQVKAIVLESFGAGNIPDDKNLFELIENYTQQGGIVINITQCYSGNVSQGMYANSLMLNQIGVISGIDLTTEAALMKIMYLLGNFKDRDEINRLISTNLVGEMSL